LAPAALVSSRPAARPSRILFIEVLLGEYCRRRAERRFEAFLRVNAPDAGRAPQPLLLAEPATRRANLH
jgi:hypothetical protein